MERVTFDQPSYPQEYSLHNSVFFEGLSGVLRTGGIKTTNSGEKRRNLLIKVNYHYQDAYNHLLHFLTIPALLHRATILLSTSG